MKECEFFKQLKEKKTNLKQEIKKHPHLQETFQINMCDALYGGQTSPIHLFKDIFSKKESKIFYINFDSLYPYIQHKNAFPINHPKSIMNNRQCLEELINLTKPGFSDKQGMGFAKCTI